MEWTAYPCIMFGIGDIGCSKPEWVTSAKIWKRHQLYIYTTLFIE